MMWHYKSFDQLNLRELYAIMKLRQEVFVVEQDCPYVDADDKDQACWHLWTYDDESELHIIAYARIVPPGVSYDVPAIGRIITAESVRRQGFGKKLMEEAIRRCESEFGKTDIKMSAQTYLIDFYGEFGFEVCSEEYLEDGLPHVAMRRNFEF